MGGGLIRQIEAAQYCEQPWPHLEFYEFLAPEEARSIADNWPTDGFQWLRHSDIAKPDGTSLRKVQPLSARFEEICERLCSEETEQAFRERLGVNSGRLYPIAQLVEDLPGYWIRRHTDCAGKVISAQFYLAEDDQHEMQGVCFEDKQMPYLFNHGYAFKVTNSSWHRVRKSQTRRRSVQLIYYSIPNPKL
jgi:hypothetical protein